MDNREIDAAIAKVMGWKVKSIQTSSRSWADAWVNDDEKIMAYDREWKPTSDISAAWQVVRRLEELGYWAQIRTPFDLGLIGNDGYWCGFTPHQTTGWNGRPDHWTNAPTITMAICLAALQAVGVDRLTIIEP